MEVTMGRKKLILTTCFLALMVFFSCKKEKTNSSSKTVKYEITGNFTGQLMIVINDNVNGNTVINNVSLPWSLEKTYAGNVTGIGIGAQSTVGAAAGQTAAMKIYVGGKEEAKTNGTSDANGGMAIPTLAYIFK